MPYKPKTPCHHPGCPNLTDGKYCVAHKKLHANDRPGVTARGYDARWRKARIRFLSIHPWCKHCAEKNKIMQATVVDHILPHRGDEKLFWDEGNWQPLCKRCHDQKTLRKERNPLYNYSASK